MIDAGLGEREKRLLERVVALDDTYDEPRLTAPQAVLQGESVLKELIGSNSSAVHDADSCNQTALHMACLLGDSNAVKYIIEAGALLNVRDIQGRTPLLVALRYGHYSCAWTLIDASCDMMAQDKFGYNALYFAMQECISETLGLIQYLISLNPTLVGMKERCGRTTLHWLEDIYEPPHLVEELVDLLLQAGADLEVRDDYGYTPLLWAVAEDNALIVRLLLQAGADRGKFTADHRNILHLVALFGSLDVIHVLSDASATNVEIDASDAQGNTPLDYWRWRVYANTNPSYPGMVPPTLEENTAFESLLQSTRNHTFLEEIDLCQSVLQMIKNGDHRGASKLLGSTAGATITINPTILLQIKGALWETAITELEAWIESRRRRLAVPPFKEESNYWFPDDSSVSESEISEFDGSDIGSLHSISSQESAADCISSGVGNIDAALNESDKDENGGVRLDDPFKNYATAIAEDISKHLMGYMVDDQIVRTLTKLLPTLLKALAFSLGYRAKSQMRRDIMLLVYKHRK